MGINNLDFSTKDVAGTVVNLADDVSPVMPYGAKGALITVEASQLRYRDDGTAPTASVGHILAVGDVLTLDSWTVPKADWRQVMQRMNFIQGAASTTGTLNISWYD